MQKKYDKMARKLNIERQRQKREVKRKIKIVSQKVQILAYAHAQKQKSCLIIRLVGKYALIVAKLILAILMLINRKQCKKEELVTNPFFSLLLAFFKVVKQNRPETRRAYHLHKPSGYRNLKHKHNTIKFDVVGERSATKYN